MRSSVIGKGCFLLLLAGLILPAMQAAAQSDVVTKGSKAAGMNSCVAPTEVIRRNHMDFLKHDRDETVRNGMRGEEFSLAECVDCHAAKDAAGKPIPIDAEGQFCQACHAYVAASPDCFMCHRTTPEAQRHRYGFQPPQSLTVFPTTAPAGTQRD